MKRAFGRFLFFLALFPLVMCPALSLAVLPGVVLSNSIPLSVHSPKVPAAAYRALGYKGSRRGDYPWEEACRCLARKTRNYAKRQLKWWRPDKRSSWVNI